MVSFILKQMRLHKEELEAALKQSDKARLTKMREVRAMYGSALAMRLQSEEGMASEVGCSRLETFCCI